MAHYLPEAVESVMKSSFPGSLELIVVNDGSTDRSANIIDQLPGSYQGHRWRITALNAEHRGKAAALNQALNVANGRYITVLDADDRLTANSLALRLERARESGADLVLGGFSTFHGREVFGYRPPPAGRSGEALVRDLLFKVKSPFHQNSMLVARELIERVGPYDERLFRAQDKEYAIRLLRTANRIEIIDRPVYRYRRYKRGYVRRLRNRMRTLRYKWMVIARHTGGLTRWSAQAWGLLVEVGKMIYELFSIYRK